MKVSVCVTTYNHAQYISQCVKSVLMQQTDFDYEIVIGEDDSKDGTREIVKEYKETYPEQIRLFLNDRKNIIYINGKPTGRWNFMNNLKQSQGEYIALLDGDDYWTSPHKLQKQVDFLDSHSECSVCFHPVRIIYAEGDRRPQIAYPRKKNKIYTLKDLLKGNFMHTCSVMFRRGLFSDFPDWFYKVAVGDWPLHILNAQHGDIGYIDEVMGAYRVHSGGIYTSREGIEQVRGMIEAYPFINGHLNFSYNRLIKRMIYFKVIEKKVGIFLASHGLSQTVSFYRKLFYGLK